MFDPFGLRQEMESPHTPTAETAAAATNPSGDKRLWAVLLILDTVFLAVFGGTLGGMIYIRWSHPSVIVMRVPLRKAEPKTAPPVTPSSPMPQTATPISSKPAAQAAPAPQPSARAPEHNPISTAKHGPGREQTASPSHAAPAIATVKSNLPVGSPGVLSSSLPRRQAGLNTPGGSAPTAATSASAPTPEARPATKSLAKAGKAQAVEFTCVAKDAQEVKLKGPFLVRTGGHKKMTRDSNGVWHTEVSLLPGTYRYIFVIDGKKSKPQTVEVE